jgi:hypothetical protein
VVREEKTYADLLPVILGYRNFFVKIFLHIFALRKTTLNLSQDN